MTMSQHEHAGGRGAEACRAGLGRFQGFREGTTILIILAIGVVMSFLSPSS